MINFVSNLPSDLRSGGFSAVNAASYAALSAIDAVNYVGPISPPSIAWQKLMSKALRVVGVPADFSFFSSRRLSRIAREVTNRCDESARFDYFHGFTPWVLTKSRRPYVALSDCIFRDYIEIFHQRSSFRRSDLARIEREEAAWLKQASRVLFSSQWAADRAVDAYQLEKSRITVVGVFGEIDEPESDAFAGSNDFLFVATNFHAKGGPVVIAALQRVRDRHPDASLTVIGERPGEISDVPGVKFAGFLRKEDAGEYTKYVRLLAGARALVHPTKSDITPLIIVESGYFGCPAISSRKFAIPELVSDRKTGILVDDPSDAAAVADAMLSMLEEPDAYSRMRAAAAAKARRDHSKAEFQRRLSAAAYGGIQAQLRTAASCQQTGFRVS